EGAVQAGGELEMDVGCPVRVLRERIAGRLDRLEPVPPLGIGHDDAVALEVRIERRGIRVGRMVIASRSVCLPDLDLGALDRIALEVEHPPDPVDDLSFRSSFRARATVEI